MADEGDLMLQKDVSKEPNNVKDDENEEFDNDCVPQMKRLSYPTWAMLATELCERFSYYGIKAGMVLYFTQGLLMTRTKGKAWYHAFGMISYFTGLVGAIMADSWLGKYKTILCTLIVYSLSEIVLTLTSIPSIGQGKSVGPLISLVLMAAACGNVKPCLGAFGGDQVNSKDVGLIKTFFSMFYASVNVGATFAMIFAPMMRTDIQCFGGDCYPAVFGLNTIFIVLALVSYLTGRKGYVKHKPQGNMVVQVGKIIVSAIRGKWNYSGVPKEHWLYYADEDVYKRKDVDDVRALLKVLTMFIPLPVFWALFHQQGSSWTLQATQMNGQLGSFELRSDQLQALNPVLVLILIPLYDVVIYPVLEKCGIKLTSLKRMVCGMLLTALSFAITGFVQMKIQDVASYPLSAATANNNMLFLDYINMSPCESIELKYSSVEINLKYGDHTGYKSFPNPQNFSLDVVGHNCYAKKDEYRTTLKDLNIESESGIYQTILLDIEGNKMVANVRQQRFPKVNMKKSESRIRTLLSSGVNATKLSLSYKHQLNGQEALKLSNFSTLDGTVRFIPISVYNLVLKNTDGTTIPVEMKGDINFNTFGEYTVTLKRRKGIKSSPDAALVGHVYSDVMGTSVHRFAQLPQYIVVTAGEVMFSVTGLEFSYSQAPKSMKSVLQAFWMLSVAFGDLVVVLISVINPVDGVVEEMFLYGALMVVVAIIFAVMCMFYTYNDFSGRSLTAEDGGDEVEGAAGTEKTVC